MVAGHPVLLCGYCDLGDKIYGRVSCSLYENSLRI